MNTLIKDMLGGFVNGCISPKVFEKHLYASLNDYQKELDKNTYDMLIYLDYSEYNDVLHLKNLLANEYPADKYNDAYFQSTQDSELAEAYKLSHPDLTDIVFDLSSVTTTEELFVSLGRTLGFPASSCKNRAAFEDYLDLSKTKSITINGYGHFYQHNQKDAMLLVWLISKHKNKDCVLTVNN